MREETEPGDEVALLRLIRTSRPLTALSDVCSSATTARAWSHRQDARSEIKEEREASSAEALRQRPRLLVRATRARDSSNAEEVAMRVQTRHAADPSSMPTLLGSPCKPCETDTSRLDLPRRRPLRPSWSRPHSGASLRAGGSSGRRSHWAQRGRRASSRASAWCRPWASCSRAGRP